MASAFTAFVRSSSSSSPSPSSSACCNLVLKATVGLRYVHHSVSSSGSSGSSSASAAAASPPASSYTSSGGHLMISSSLPALYHRYAVVQPIAEGTFSQLVQAEDRYNSNTQVAIKIMNSNCAYIGEEEVRVLQVLNSADSSDQAHIVRLLKSFTFGEHFCLVLELLSSSLVDLLAGIQTQQQQQGLRLAHIRKIAFQSLLSLMLLRRCRLIHADIKPENLVVSSSNAAASNHQRMHIKLIDFGNAFSLDQRSVYYEDFELQSLFYRAPEVVVGDFGFDFGIDMWSFGCVLAELYTGRPLFRVQHSRDLPFKMQQILGPFPWQRFSSAKFIAKFSADPRALLATDAEAQPLPTTLNNLERILGCEREPDFVRFLGSLLKYDPDERPTPQQALFHPFFAELVPLSFIMNPPSSSPPSPLSVVASPLLSVVSQQQQVFDQPIQQQLQLPAQTLSVVKVDTTTNTTDSVVAEREPSTKRRRISTSGTTNKENNLSVAAFTSIRNQGIGINERANILLQRPAPAPSSRMKQRGDDHEDDDAILLL